VARVRKALVALLGAAAEVASNSALPQKYQAWASVVIALAVAVGVYQIPNAVAGSADDGGEPH
jgi:hypothetical protein